MCSCRKVQAPDGFEQQRSGIVAQATVPLHIARTHPAVAIHVAIRETEPLPFPGRLDPGSNFLRCFARGRRSKRSDRQSRHLYLQVDSVQQGAGKFPAVGFHDRRRAGAGSQHVPEESAGAGIHGGHERESRGKGDRRRRASDHHPTVLERLPHDFQNIARKLRKFVEEQDAVVRQRDFSRAWNAAAAREPRVRNRVMRRTKRPPRHQRVSRRQQPGHGIHAGDVQRLIHAEGWQNGG